MPVAWALRFTTADGITVTLALVLLALVGAMGYRAWQRSRITPEERERARRALLTSRGKMGDATLVEVRGEFLFYSYDVRGVEYTASQDVSLLKELLPRELSLEGPIAVKYDAKNPANSIILSEQWSGLRESKAG